MTNARANMFDVLWPIGMAIPEYLMFIVIDPEFGKTGSLDDLVHCVCISCDDGIHARF